MHLALLLRGSSLSPRAKIWVGIILAVSENSPRAWYIPMPRSCLTYQGSIWCANAYPHASTHAPQQNKIESFEWNARSRRNFQARERGAAGAKTSCFTCRGARLVEFRARGRSSVTNVVGKVCSENLDGKKPWKFDRSKQGHHEGLG